MTSASRTPLELRMAREFHRRWLDHAGLAARADADVDHIPDQCDFIVKNTATLALQLLKRFRNIRYASYTGRIPPSVMLSYYAGLAAQPNMSLSAMLVRLASWIIRDIEQASLYGRLLHIVNPVCAALLNAQPMGFYAPAQIVRDAREHGVDVRPVCVNDSRWDCTLEPTQKEDCLAVRLGLRMVRGLSNADAAAFIAARASASLRPMTSGAAPASRLPRSCSLPKQTPSGRHSNLRGVRRCGRSRRCATSLCRSSRLLRFAKQGPSRNSANPRSCSGP